MVKYIKNVNYLKILLKLWIILSTHEKCQLGEFSLVGKKAQVTYAEQTI